MEQSCWKIPFSILQFTKKAQKAILWSRLHFFIKFVIFAGKLLSFWILYLACPKHVGTPCIFDESNFMIHALQNSVLRPGVTTSIKVALKKQLCFSHAQFIQSIVVGPCNIFYVSVALPPIVKTECSAELTSWDF